MYELNSASLLESRTVLKKKKKTLYKNKKNKPNYPFSLDENLYVFFHTHKQRPFK